MRKGRVYIILLLLLSGGLHAQFYEYGQDAGKLRWNQYRTAHYQVVFPEGVEEVASGFARRLEAYYPYLGENLDHQHGRVPVIVHHESAFSNGVSVWAPKRLEIYSNPDPNGYNQDWLTQLAIHEGRHVVQIDKLNQGFTRGLYFLSGEQGVGAMAVFLPYWYLEGDAVDAETRLTLGGRGRLPSFERGLKAQMLEEGKLYSFDKATMGSYKDYIPNHYELGYLLVHYGRKRYGDRFWIDFQNHAARRPFLLNPTFFSMRKYGLKSKSAFYKEAMGFYRDHWSARDSMRTLSPGRVINQQEKTHFTQYEFPQAGSAGEVFAYKSGLDQIPEFVALDSSGEERRIFRPGYMSSGRFTLSERYLVWDEFVPDTRWSNRNFSVLRRLDLNSGECIFLGKKTRYYSPSFSSDGNYIVAIEQNSFQQYALVILDHHGKLLEHIPSENKHFIQHPAWMEGDTAILMVRSEGTSKSLVSYDLESKQWRILFDAGNEDISHPVQQGNWIYFSGTFTGIDNIFRLSLENGQVVQLSASRFGAKQAAPLPGGEQILYADYSARGQNLMEMMLDEGMHVPLEEARDRQEQVDFQPSAREQQIMEEVDLTDSISMDLKPYRKWANLFNVHSWLPFYFDYLNPHLDLRPEQLPVSLGLSLISQNHLSTAVSQVGYEYKDGFHYFHSGIQLKGRYPVLNMYFDYGGEPNILILNEPGDTTLSLPRDMGFRAESYVPFRLNTGKVLSLIQPGLSYRYSKDLEYLEEKGSYRSGIHFLHYSLYATSYLRKGLRDIWPRVGFTFNGGYRHAPFDSRVYGAVSYASMYAYVPGVLKHQSLRLSMHRQVQYPLDPQRPIYQNLISGPRGMDPIYAEKMTRYSADYVMPLLYPDLGTILYVKRIRTNLWMDYLVGEKVIRWEPQARLEDRNFLSVGLDLWLDLNLLRISFPVSVGARVGWEDDRDRYFADFLFAIDIN